MKIPSLLFCLSLMATLVTGCAMERTYIQPIEKRQIQAGPKPKDFDSSSFGKMNYRNQNRRY